MKQVKFLLLAAFVAMFTGCQNEEIMEQDSEKDARLDMVKETEEKVQKIIHNLKKAQARQKSYAHKR